MLWFFEGENLEEASKLEREISKSSGQKKILIKVVVQTITLYTMNYFLLPRYFLEDLNHLIFAFWWNGMDGEKKIHWTSLEKLCALKCEGGLGFRNLYAFNLAMLAKQGWRLTNEPKSLVARVLKAKYFPNCSFMEAQIKNEASLY